MNFIVLRMHKSLRLYDTSYVPSNNNSRTGKSRTIGLLTRTYERYFVRLNYMRAHTHTHEINHTYVHTLITQKYDPYRRQNRNARVRHSSARFILRIVRVLENKNKNNKKKKTATLREIKIVIITIILFVFVAKHKKKKREREYNTPGRIDEMKFRELKIRR